MPRAFISVGSNINPAENVLKAMEMLSQTEDVKGISTVYETEPLGRPGDPRFYNCVVEVETRKTPGELKLALKEIEDRLGRERGDDDGFAPRTADLDMILYGHFIDQGMKLPSVEIETRPFVAMPLAELAPTLRHPVSGLMMEEIAKGLDGTGMKPLESYTASLRAGLAGKK